jgi:hypothetical protein
MRGFREQENVPGGLEREDPEVRPFWGREHEGCVEAVMTLAIFQVAYSVGRVNS